MATYETPNDDPPVAEMLAIIQDTEFGTAKLKNFRNKIVQHLPNTRLEDYDCLEKLGQGGFGSVFRCMEKRTQREYAIKVVQRNDHTDLSTMMERNVLVKLDSPWIMPLRCAFRCTKRAYLVMPLMRGSIISAFAELKRRPHEKKLLMAQILAGLQYIHKNRVIHMDLKPDNILLDKNFRVKISDFGCSSLVPDNIEFVVRRGCTLGYCSPEYYATHHVTTAHDLFSAGCIFFEILHPKSEKLFPYTEVTIRNILRADYSRYLTEMMKDLGEDASDFLKLHLARNYLERKNGLNSKYLRDFANEKELLQARISRIQFPKQKPLNPEDELEYGNNWSIPRNGEPGMAGFDFNSSNTQAMSLLDQMQTCFSTQHKRMHMENESLKAENEDLKHRVKGAQVEKRELETRRLKELSAEKKRWETDLNAERAQASALHAKLLEEIKELKNRLTEATNKNKTDSSSSSSSSSSIRNPPSSSNRNPPSSSNLIPPPSKRRRTTVKPTTTSGGQFQCAQCDKSYTRKEKLKLHIESHHQDHRLSIVCTLCPMTFRRKDLLQQHMRSHSTNHGSKCTVCKKTFKYRSQLQRHRISERH